VIERNVNGHDGILHRAPVRDARTKLRQKRARSTIRMRDPARHAHF
jgi:hypothetical protein